MTKYKLLISEKQAETISKALDLFSRIGIAQFEEVLRHPQWRKRLLTDPTGHDVCQKLLSEVKSILANLPQNASYGIGSPEVGEESKIAYDVLQVIRYRLAWDKNPNGGMQVNFDKPSSLSKEPLSNISKVEEG